MKIIYIEMQRGDSYSYYNEIRKSLSKKHELYVFSNWNTKDDREIKVTELISVCKSKPDLIFFGFGWTDCSENYPKIIKNIEKLDLPIAVFLNKEYAALEKKLDWIRNLNPIAVFSVHHDYREFEQKTGIPFYQIPFAVNSSIFKKYENEVYDCDFGFSGIIRPEQTNNWRAKIVEKSKEWKDIDFSFSQHRHDSLEAYARRINRAKIWLSTTGPVDIVSPRYYEVMALGTTLLICNRLDRVYSNIINEDEHCVMFDSVDEMEKKVRYYLANPNEMNDIINKAKEHTLQNHTWDHRAEKITKILREVIND